MTRKTILHLWCIMCIKIMPVDSMEPASLSVTVRDANAGIKKTHKATVKICKRWEMPVGLHVCFTAYYVGLDVYHLTSRRTMTQCRLIQLVRQSPSERK